MLFEKIKSGNYDADDPIWDNVSDGGKDLVEKLLTVDAEKRLTAEEALNHPWVQGKFFEDEQQGGKGGSQRSMLVSSGPQHSTCHPCFSPECSVATPIPPKHYVCGVSDSVLRDFVSIGEVRVGP